MIVRETRGVGLPKRNVARCVFVEQSVVEQRFASCDRRRIRHEPDFSQSTRTLVAADQPLKCGLTSRRLNRQQPAVAELDADLIDERSGQDEWF